MKRYIKDCNKNIDKSDHASETLGTRRKRSKRDESSSKEYETVNFSLACLQVSGAEYFDFRSRFKLIYLPSCVEAVCKHEKDNGSIKQMPTYAEESFRTEIRNQMWYDALEVCHMCITPTQYLSSDVLQDIVEIMLNVHDDKYSEYSAKYIVDNCQQVLLQNFSTHPPCQNKNLRNCYVKFLTTSMPSKNHTHTDRSNYEHNKGIVKYCMNRLECELSADSSDGPIVVKNVPEHLKDTVKGFHWQKQNFEIFETLNREERIKRLFAVLETIIELFQFDLAIQHSRYLNNERRQMRSSKLMEHILWSTNDVGVVTGSCRQIIRIFANIVHLRYPPTIVNTIATWLSITIQTIYARDPCSNCDYPNNSKNCIIFGNEFYDIIADWPHDSIIRVLERIEPTYIRHIVGLFYLNAILSINEGCIFKIIQNFLTESKWKLYPTNNVEIKLSRNLYHPPKRGADKMSYLLNNYTYPESDNTSSMIFPKKGPKMGVNRTKPDLNVIIQTLYITLDASLDSNRLQSVQDTWNALNKQILNKSFLSVYNSYSVSEQLIGKYKHNLNAIKELSCLFNDLKNLGLLPQAFNIFGNISLLQLQI